MNIAILFNGVLSKTLLAKIKSKINLIYNAPQYTIFSNKGSTYISNNVKVKSFNKYLEQKTYDIIIDFGCCLRFPLYKISGLIIILKDKKIPENIDSMIQLDRKVSYEKRIVAYSTAIYNIVKDIPTLDTIINNINDFTIKLNDLNMHKKSKRSLRVKRAFLMKNIRGYLNKKNEYFIIPYIIPYKYVSQDVAIVGNSRKLLRNPQGKRIDKHKNVFRFNYAVTDGFEKYCGHTADIRLGNLTCFKCETYAKHPKGLIKDYEMYKKLKENSIVVFSRKKISYDRLLKLATKNNIPSDKTLHNIEWDFRMFEDVLDYFGHKIDADCQVGLATILLMIDLSIIPRLYGFDTEVCSDNYGYYWSKKVKHKVLSSCHNIKQEHKIIKDFINKKIVIYYR